MIKEFMKKRQEKKVLRFEQKLEAHRLRDEAEKKRNDELYRHMLMDESLRELKEKEKKKIDNFVEEVNSIRRNRNQISRKVGDCIINFSNNFRTVSISKYFNNKEVLLHFSDFSFHNSLSDKTPKIQVTIGNLATNKVSKFYTLKQLFEHPELEFIIIEVSNIFQTLKKESIINENQFELSLSLLNENIKEKKKEEELSKVLQNIDPKDHSIVKELLRRLEAERENHKRVG